MKDDKVYIEHILDAIAKIEDFSKDLSRAEFEKDRKTQSAVILQLVIIGEMVKRVSDQTKDLIKIPWKDIAGFRDVAIHDYYEVDLNIVWDTLQADLKVLKTELLKYKH